MSTLSVCLIAKNEEKNIKRCLESIKGIADEIILVDTGSTDLTMKIAEQYGAKLIEEPWENDFSKARNTSLQYATKEWILVLDCDEELPIDQGKALKELLESNPKEQAFHCRLINVITGQSDVTAVVLRIFRNDPRHRFEGKMHEQVVKTIAAAHGVESIVAKDITIMHYGYDGNVVSQDEKSKRNLELLMAYPESERDGYYYYALGNEYTRLKNLNEAIACYKRSYEKTEQKDNKVIYYAYLILHWMNTYFNAGEYGKMITLYEEVEQTLPYFRDLYLIASLAYREVGKLWKAQELLEKYMSCQMTYFEYPSNQYGHVDVSNIYEVTRKECVKPCIIGCYRMREFTPEILDGIKNLNAATYCTYIFVREEDRERLQEGLEKIRRMSVEIIFIKNDAKLQDLSVLYNKVRRNWLLILEEDEIMPFTVVRLLPELIEGTSEKCYNVVQVDLASQKVTQVPRLKFITRRMDFKQESKDAKASYMVIYKKQGM
ncbi:MAG: glycosyltransferase [Cellulosilyticaceae bacterium]